MSNTEQLLYSVEVVLSQSEAEDLKELRKLEQEVTRLRERMGQAAKNSTAWHDALKYKAPSFTYGVVGGTAKVTHALNFSGKHILAEVRMSYQPRQITPVHLDASTVNQLLNSKILTDKQKRKFLKHVNHAFVEILDED